MGGGPTALGVWDERQEEPELPAIGTFLDSVTEWLLVRLTETEHRMRCVIFFGGEGMVRV